VKRAVEVLFWVTIAAFIFESVYHWWAMGVLWVGLLGTSAACVAIAAIALHARSQL